MQGQTRTRLRWAFILCAASVVGAQFLFAATVARAVPAPPQYTWSYYVLYSDTNPDPTSPSGNAYTLGCNQGRADARSGDNSDVQLLFGGQNPQNTGAVNGISGNFQTYAQVEEYAEHFAYGYWLCTATDTTTLLRLDISTNSDYTVSEATGVRWAEVVQAAFNWSTTNGYASQVDLIGGDDIEPGFSASWAQVQAWIVGYENTTTLLYEDNPSADGCPTNTTTGGGGSPCGFGWNQYDVWYAAWGATPAIPLPQIYNTDMPLQWAEISMYSYLYHGGEIRFSGPMSDHDLEGSHLTYVQAWDDFWNALNAHSQTVDTPPFVTEVHQSN